MESQQQDWTGFSEIGAQEGPALPPGLANGLKVDDKEKSALKDSIKKKGGNSYYYAHNYEGQNFSNEQAKTFYGDGLIYGGEPKLIGESEKKVT